MEAVNLSDKPATSARLVERIASAAGVDLRDCYQCGKCAAGCPVAPRADLTCRQVIRSLQLGQAEAVLAARMPWACLGCGVCLARCPQGVDLPSLMAAITRVATDEGCVAVRDAKVFQEVFLGITHTTGISDEVLLAGGYNLASGHAFQDVANVPAMMRRGLIEVAVPRTVQDPQEIQALFARCRAAQESSREREDRHATAHPADPAARPAAPAAAQQPSAPESEVPHES